MLLCAEMNSHDAAHIDKAEVGFKVTFRRTGESRNAPSCQGHNDAHRLATRLATSVSTDSIMPGIKL